MSLIVARRYARALHEDAAAKNAVKDVDADIAMIQESLAGSPELRRFFADPMISSDKKGVVIDALFEKRVHAATLNFMHLLTDKRRENIFTDILNAYSDLRNEQLGIIEARVRVALPLNAKDEQKIKESIEKMTGKQVHLKTDMDPSILGGIIIRVGDMVYDGSVHHQLETLKDRLALSSLHAN